MVRNGGRKNCDKYIVLSAGVGVGPRGNVGGWGAKAKLWGGVPTPTNLKGRVETDKEASTFEMITRSPKGRSGIEGKRGERPRGRGNELPLLQINAMALQLPGQGKIQLHM